MTIASITILGAGAMGCYFAARLCEAGYSVTLVDVDLRPGIRGCAAASSEIVPLCARSKEWWRAEGDNRKN